MNSFGLKMNHGRTPQTNIVDEHVEIGLILMKSLLTQFELLSGY